jgi:hypothetical protein
MRRKATKTTPITLAAAIILPRGEVFWMRFRIPFTISGGGSEEG